MVCPNDDVMIWDPSERILWGIGITIAIMCGLYFIHIGRKRKVFKERINMWGLASLPLGFAFSLLFTYFQVLQVHGTYDFDTNLFCGDYESHEPLYELFGILSFISFGLGGMFFVLAFDIIVKRTKYILTIISGGFLVIEIIFAFINVDIAREVFNVFLILDLVFFVPFILFIYTKRAHFEFKAVSSFLFFGFILFMISLILAFSAHKKLNTFPLILGPILLIAGSCIMIIPIIIDPRGVSRPLIYWVLFAILINAFLIGITIIDIFVVTRKELWSVKWILFIGEYIVSIIYFSTLMTLIIKNIRSEMISMSQEIMKEDEAYKDDFLAMFTRPQQVNFLASISHELKTPLTSIIGFTRTILKGRAGEINEEQEKQLNIILNSANYLHELIIDVIDMTKIEISKLTIRKEKFNLVEELINLKETFSVAAKEKGLDLFADTPENLIIYNDKQRINQILINLIGNAIKFTDSGKISIKIKRKKENAVISVKDTGPGIQKEDLKKLFKPFSRILEPGKFKEGSGLGLHLSKKLAILLGGDITVKSKFGKGSTFKLILKREEEEISN